MIYRIIGPGYDGKLKGAYYAGLGWSAMDIPAPQLSDPRLRFWFTEQGWKDYGVKIIGYARQEGRKFRVFKRKNPPRSAVMYRDRWQVALLPVKR